jgi:hypothetical protein
MQIQIAINNDIAINFIVKNDLTPFQIECTPKSSKTYLKVLKNECFSFNKHVKLFLNFFN